MVYSFGMLFGRRSSKLLARSIHAAIALLFAFSGRLQYALPPPIADQSQQRADVILIMKKDHVMELLAGGKVIRTYKVALGQGGLPAKQREGDARTPEGHYVIDARL
jgi:hypothetical protein